MKKTVSFCMIFVLVLSLLTPFVSAAGGLTQKRAVKLFERGYGRSELIIFGWLYDLGWLTNNDVEKYLFYNNMYSEGYNNETKVVFEESSSGEKYDVPVAFYPLYAHNSDNIYSETDGDRLTLDFLNKYIDEYFTEEMKARLFTGEYSYYDKEAEKRIYKECERFRTDPETGYVLATETSHYHPQFNHMDLGRTLKVLDFESTAASAEMRVLTYSGGYAGGDYSPHIETVKFEKTKKGWRISGGSLFEVEYFGGENSYEQEISEFEHLTAKAYAEACNLFENYTDHCEYISTHNGKSYYWYGSSWGPIASKTDEYTTITYTHSLKGEKYDTPQVYYRSQIGNEHLYINFNNADDYKEYLSSIFMLSLYERWLYNENGDVEYFRNESKDGGILVAECFYRESEDRRYGYYYSDYNGVKMLSSNKAQIEVILGGYNAEKREYEKYITSFYAEKTKDGWRASGGEMFDVIRGKADPKPYIPIVETGDGDTHGAIFFSLLAIVSFAGICPAVVRKGR